MAHGWNGERCDCNGIVGVGSEMERSTFVAGDGVGAIMRHLCTIERRIGWQWFGDFACSDPFGKA